MSYIWNPEFDIFCLHDRIDFVALNHEVSFEGEASAKAIGKLINPSGRQEGGFTLPDAIQELASFDEKDVTCLWEAFLQESVLRESDSIPLQERVTRTHESYSCLSEHLPHELSGEQCRQIGFRFGGYYFLAILNEEMPALHFAKQAIEWAFSGKWLDRARPLFWQTEEKIVLGKRFLPSLVQEWLQSTVDTLLATCADGSLYMIDLHHLQVGRHPLCSPHLPVGILAPIIVEQSDITTNEEQTAFIPQCSIIQSRYRQIGVWDSGQRCLSCGAHPSLSIARSISAAEAIERSAAATYDMTRLSFGKSEDDPRRVDPRHLIDMDDRQQRDGNLCSFDPGQPYYWQNAMELMGGLETQVIADLCYFPFNPLGYNWRVAWGNSSGMAAGRTIAEAQQSALFELIERDAFMITWITRRSPPHIPDSLIPDGIRESRHQMKTIGYDTALMDLTIHGVPTVLAAAYRDEWPALILGAATRNTLREALCDAWKEVEVGLYCRLLDPMMAEKDKPLLQEEEVGRSDDHAKFYNHPEHLARASFLWSSDRRSSRTSEEPFCKSTSASNIVNFCRQLAVDQLYCVDYGVRWGLHIVRLLTPQLVPLTFGYNQLPWRHVARTVLPNTHIGMLPGVCSVHPFD